MKNAITMAGYYASHAVWSVCDGDTLIPNFALLFLIETLITIKGPGFTAGDHVWIANAFYSGLDSHDEGANI